MHLQYIKMLLESFKYNFPWLKSIPTIFYYMCFIHLVIGLFLPLIVNKHILPEITTAFVHFKEFTKCLKKVEKYFFIWKLHHSLHGIYSLCCISGMNSFVLHKRKILLKTISKNKHWKLLNALCLTNLRASSITK